MANYPVRAGVAVQVNPKLPVIQESSTKKKSHQNTEKGLHWFLGWK